MSQITAVYLKLAVTSDSSCGMSISSSCCECCELNYKSSQQEIFCNKHIKRYLASNNPKHKSIISYVYIFIAVHAAETSVAGLEELCSTLQINHMYDVIKFHVCRFHMRQFTYFCI